MEENEIATLHPLTAEEVATMIEIGDFYEIVEGLTVRMLRIADMETAANGGTENFCTRILRDEAFAIIGDLGEERITHEEGFVRCADMLVTVENCDCTNEYIAAVCNNPNLPLGHFAEGREEVRDA